jgi:radical SAM-linked protein
MKKQRVRIFFSKTAEMRFTGHLDLILSWERTFRRAGMPLAYSEGYNPRPLINLAAPLPLGFTSQQEIGDFWLSKTTPIPILNNALQSALPPGLLIQELIEIKDLFGAKLPTLVQAASYQVELLDSFPDLYQKLKQLLQSSTLIRTRKGKSYDLRALIISLEFISQQGLSANILVMTLVNLPGATGRPDEVLATLEIPVESARICRTEIILQSGES